ncbi:MAG: transcription elongation factor GreA [Nannocystaceae bacterium]|nr:transcription elongation factor GreA [Nannocystaceae bacterium]
MADETYPMTPEGLRTLKAELKQIREIDRPHNVQEIEEALEHGDLRENAEYHAAKDRQAELDARMRFAEYRISRSKVIDPAKMSSPKVAFGATVTVLDMNTDKEDTYSIVGEHEFDVDRGRISFKSPVARVLMGKEEGDEAVLKLPRGDRELEVVSIEYKALE